MSRDLKDYEDCKIRVESIKKRDLHAIIKSAFYTASAT